MKKIFVPNNGTFSAFYAAEKFVKNMGLCANSMERDRPIAITNEYIGKWRHLNSIDKKELIGTITSNDFRDGDVMVTIFDDVDVNPY